VFYIIGIGLTPKQITQEAKNAIDSCNNIYIDNYTNIFSQGKIEELEKIISKKITQLQRKELEQSLEYLKDDSCLLVIGNAFSATTHYTLIEEAKNKNIKIKMIPENICV
jgi:diphthamide biosynthesis methyltransferase